MRALVALLVILALSAMSEAVGSSSSEVESCKARPVVSEFVHALGSGDLDRLDQLFAPKAHLPAAARAVLEFVHHHSEMAPSRLIM
jgi:hypothetical protein